MATKLFSEGRGGLLSPLLDVVVNALAGIFIILMIFLAIARPVEHLEFITGVEPPPTICGIQYTFTFPVAGGGSGERLFQLLEGLLPPGIEFETSTGTLYGVPTCLDENGRSRHYELHLQVQDPSGTDQRTSSLTVFPGAIPYAPAEMLLTMQRVPGELPSARMDLPYHQLLGATGGVHPYRWTVASGRLPLGLTLQDGHITGTPEESGNFQFEVRVSHLEGSFSYRNRVFNWAGATQTRAFSLVVLQDLRHNLQLSIGRVGESYSGFVKTNDRLVGERIHLDYDIPGIITSPIGVLHGTPTQAGTFDVSYHIEFDDAQLASGTGEMLILPQRPATVAGGEVLQAWVGESFSYPIPYRGLQEPVTTSPLHDLPEGVRLDTSALTGTAREPGLHHIPFRANGALGNRVDGEVILRVGPSRTPLSIEMSGTHVITVGYPVYWQARSSGGEGDHHWSMTGELPPSLQFASTGTLTGSLNRPGRWELELALEDQISGESTTQPISLRGVYPEEKTLQLVTTTIPVALVGSPYTLTFAATGGVGRYSFRFNGTLPTGLSFTDMGIEGTPTATGEYSIEVTVLDERDQSDGPHHFQLISMPYDYNTPRVISEELPLAVPGQRYVYAFAATGGIGDYNWSFDGALPPGLNFDEHGITGTVDLQATGSWTLQARVSDAAGQRSTPKQLTLMVKDGWLVLSINTDKLPTAVVGLPYHTALLAQNCWGQCEWTASGLPTGLQIRGAHISGTPQEVGTYTMEIAATDQRNQQVIRTLILEVHHRSAPPQSVEEPLMTSLDRIFTAVSNVNIRTEPSRYSNKTGYLRAGAEVRVTGKVIDKNWYRIERPDGGIGFVWAPLLQEAQAEAD